MADVKKPTRDNIDVPETGRSPLSTTITDSSGTIQKILFAYRGVTLLSTESTHVGAAQYRDDDNVSWPRYWLGRSDYQTTELHAEDLYVYAGTRFDFACKDLVVRCRRLIIVGPSKSASTTDVVFTTWPGEPLTPEEPKGPAAKGANAVQTKSYGTIDPSGFRHIMYHNHMAETGANGVTPTFTATNGKNAGSIVFFGEIVNRTSENVKVLFDSQGQEGGKGAKGQQGGKGGDGMTDSNKNFYTPFEGDNNNNADLCNAGNGGNGSNGTNGANGGNGGAQIIRSTHGDSTPTVSVEENVNKGELGPGGDAGKGGESGTAGYWIETFAAPWKDDIQHGGWQQSGSSGTPGNPGTAGEQGFLLTTENKNYEGTFIDLTHVLMVQQRLNFEWEWAVGLQTPLGDYNTSEDGAVGELLKLRFQRFGASFQWVKSTISKLSLQQPSAADNHDHDQLVVDVLGSFDILPKSEDSFRDRMCQRTLACWGSDIKIDEYSSQHYPMKGSESEKEKQDIIEKRQNSSKRLKTAVKKFEKSLNLCLGMVKQLEDVQKSQTSTAGWGFLDVPQANTRFTYILQSLEETRKLKAEKDRLQSQLDLAARNRENTGIDKQKFVNYRTNAKSDLKTAQDQREKLLAALPGQVSDVGKAKTIAQAKLDGLYESHRPSQLASCSSLMSVLSVVGNCLMFANAEVGIPLLIGAALETGSAIHSAATTSVDVKDESGNVLMSSDELDSKVLVIDRALDRSDLLRKLQGSDSANNIGKAYEKIVVAKQEFEALCDEVFNDHSLAGQAEVDVARAAFDDLVAKADLLNRSIIELKQNSVEQQRILLLESAADSYILNYDEEIQAGSDLAFEQAFDICSTVYSLQTNKMASNLLNLVRAWNAVTLTRCNILDNYIDLGSFDNIVNNSTFQISAEQAMAELINGYEALSDRNPIQTHDMWPPFTFTEVKDAERISDLKNNGKFNFCYVSGSNKRFKVDPNWYDMRLEQCSFEIPGIKLRDKAAQGPIQIGVTLGGFCSVYHFDKKEIRFNINETTFSLQADIDKGGKTDIHIFDNQTVCHMEYKDKEGNLHTFDRHIRSPMSQWLFQINDWETVKQTHDFSAVTEIKLHMNVSHRTRKPVSPAMLHLVPTTLDANAPELANADSAKDPDVTKIHLYSIVMDEPPFTRPLGHNKALIFLPGGISASTMFEKLLQPLRGGRRQEILRHNDFTKSRHGKWAGDPEVGAKEINAMSNDDIVSSAGEWHRNARVNLKRLNVLPDDRTKVMFRGPDDNSTYGKGHYTSITAVHKFEYAKTFIENGPVALTAVKSLSPASYVISPEQAKEYNREYSYTDKWEWMLKHSKEIMQTEQGFTTGSKDITGYTGLLGGAAQITLRDCGPARTYPDGSIVRVVIANVDETYHPFAQSAEWCFSYDPLYPEEIMVSHTSIGKNASYFNDYINATMAPYVFHTAQETMPFAHKAIETGKTVDRVILDHAIKNNDRHAENLSLIRRFLASTDIVTPFLVFLRQAFTKYDPEMTKKAEVIVHKATLEEMMRMTPAELETGVKSPVVKEAPGIAGYEGSFNSASVMIGQPIESLGDVSSNPAGKEVCDAVKTDLDQTVFQSEDREQIDELRKAVEKLVDKNSGGWDLKKNTPGELFEILKAETSLTTDIQAMFKKTLLGGSTISDVMNNLNPGDLAKFPDGLLEKGMSRYVSSLLFKRHDIVELWVKGHLEAKAYPELSELNEAAKLKADVAKATNDLNARRAEYQTKYQELIVARQKNDKLEIEKRVEEIIKKEAEVEEYKRKKEKAEEMHSIVEDRDERKTKHDNEVKAKEKELFPKTRNEK